jgi:hypothetical protein
MEFLRLIPLKGLLDMVFREDEQRKRANHAAKNFAIVRKIALNLLKKESLRSCRQKMEKLFSLSLYLDADPNIFSVQHKKMNQNIFIFQKYCIPLQHNLKAIHNKDYSVVKTFKAGCIARLFI